MHVRLRIDQFDGLIEFRLGVPRVIRIAGRNGEAHVRHRNRQQPLFGSALGQYEADLGLVDPGSFAVGRVVHLEYQVGSGRNQLGRAMILVEILAMHPRNVAQ